jgi:hypothetical protein
MTELDPERLLRALVEHGVDFTIDKVIASKEKLGRPKDTAALPALYATREALRRR